MLNDKVRSSPCRSSAGVGLSSGGFSYLELVVVIAILSVLLMVASQRFLALQADAEAAAMESVLGTLRSALGIKMAELIVKNDMAGIPALESSNPMDRLAELPKNYAGELDGARAVEAGNWYFDTRSRHLVYRVNNEARFEGAQDSPDRARFYVRLLYRDANGNRAFDPGQDSLEGVNLVAVEPYAWKR